MATKEEIKKRQCLLYVVDGGYYIGAIDGIWGALSKTATKCFKKDFGLADNDTYDSETEKALRHSICYGMPAKKVESTTTKSGTFWDDIKYFKRSEFKCTCGGKYCNGFPVEPDEQLVRILDKVRAKYGKPFSPNSAIRCTKRNAEVGGASNSQHLYGTAADISVPGVAPKTVAAYLETLIPNTGGIGIYSWGVHVDTRKTKSRWNG